MKKFFIGLALLNILSLTSIASERPIKNTTDSAAYYATVRVVGEQNEFMYLQVNYNPKKPAVIEITDGMGETLYAEKVANSSYSKLIKFSTQELPNGVEILFIEQGTVVKRYTLNVNFEKTYNLEVLAKTN